MFKLLKVCGLKVGRCGRRFPWRGKQKFNNPFAFKQKRVNKA